MDYYYGQALVMGKPTEIRVKPEMIQENFVNEIELYLPTHRARGRSMVKIETTWGWQTKRSAQSPPICIDIWVEVDGAKKSLKFQES